ncbi:MAG: SpoIIE family protein phosphatase [Treponemataceae bacterium]|nr:SpoIIE family protein phosphatase [Treponemataceae bacterium]
MRNESLAVLAGILTVVVAVFQLAMLMSARRKKIVRVPPSLFFAAIALVGGVLYSFSAGTISAITLTLLVENVLLIPYYLGLKNSEAEEKKRDNKYVVAEPVKQNLEEESKTLSEAETFIGTSKDIVIKASEALQDDAGLSRLVDFINTRIMREIDADGAAVLLIDDFEDIIAVKAFSGDFPPPYRLPDDVPHKVIRVETNFRFAQFGLNENIFGNIATSGKPELINSPLDDERIYQNEDEDFLKCGSYIFIPMVVADTVIGVIALARKASSLKFTKGDFDKACVLADFASVSIKNVYTFQEVIEHTDLTREAGIAGKIQKSLHPQLLPVIPGLQLGSVFNTADGVCGDYFDVLPSRKDRISFVLADVAGKGMNSLVIMVMLRAILRLVTNTTQSAATILSWANRGISIENNIDHFASLALMNYDSTTRTLEYSTAGSTPILYFNAEDDTVTKLSTSTEPIGVEKATQFQDVALQLHTNDILVMYSDGIVEAMNTAGSQYTADRLINIVRENRESSGKEIANLVKTDVKKFTGSAHQHDDQTLLVIKIN